MSNDTTEDTTITVSALSKTRTFGGVEELAEFVTEALENRGGIFNPFELACIGRLAELSNGGVPPRVHEIARKARFHSPTEPGRAEKLRREGPYGERIAEAEARVQEATEAHEAAQEAQNRVAAEGEAAVRRARDGSGSSTNASKVSRVAAEHERAFQQATENLRDARRALTRATARLNALRIAADRQRYEEEARYVHEGEAVTLAELHGLQGRG